MLSPVTRPARAAAVRTTLMQGVPSPVGHKKARGAGDEHEHDRGRFGVDAEVVNIDGE